MFLVVSYHIATIVGTPLDKAAIDLLFFYNATPGHTGRLFADSVVPYVTPGVVIEAVLAAALMPAVFFWWRRRVERGPAIGGRGVAAFAVLVFLTVAVVPGLANGLLAIHTFGLERSPLTLLVGSYVSEPVRRLIGRDTVPSGDPYCFDLHSPVPTDGENPLAKATPSRTNLAARDPGIHLLAQCVGGTNADAFSGRARAIVTTACDSRITTRTGRRR